MDKCCNCNHCASCSDRYVCHCFHVTEEQLVEAIVTLELRTLNDVQRATGAGGGCTACHARIRRHLEVHAYASPPASICSVR